MKIIDLEKEKPKLSRIFKLARREPVLLLTGDGQEFILSRADGFEAEKEALQNSHFQTLLDERKVRFPI